MYGKMKVPYIALCGMVLLVVAMISRAHPNDARKCAETDDCYVSGFGCSHYGNQGGVDECKRIGADKPVCEEIGCSDCERDDDVKTQMCAVMCGYCKPQPEVTPRQCKEPDNDCFLSPSGCMHHGNQGTVDVCRELGADNADCAGKGCDDCDDDDDDSVRTQRCAIMCGFCKPQEPRPQDPSRQDMTRGKPRRQYHTRQNKARQNKVRQDRTRQNRARRVNTRQDQMRRDKDNARRSKDNARRNKDKAHREKMRREKTRQNKARQDRTHQDRTRQNQAHRYRMRQDQRSPNPFHQTLQSLFGNVQTPVKDDCQDRPDCYKSTFGCEHYGNQGSDVACDRNDKAGCEKIGCKRCGEPDFKTKICPVLCGYCKP